MPISPQLSLLIILVVGLTTFVTRAIPFLIFRNGKEIPETVKYLGRALPPAVIGMLVVYCLKSSPCGEFSLWAAGAARDYGGSGFTRLETE